MFKKGQRLRTIGQWKDYKWVFTVVKKHPEYDPKKLWVVKIEENSEDTFEFIKYIPEDCLMLEEIYNSPLYEALREK
jgi:hypothetical protein